MLIMKSNKRLARVVLIGVVVLSLLGLFASTALALPTGSWTKYYFSDANFQNWVGERSLFCDGSRYSEGTTSAYSYISTSEGCNGGVPDGLYESKCYVRTFGGLWYQTDCR